MNHQEMEKLASTLNEDETVEHARIVEFMGKPHVHVDLASGDIEVITQEGKSRAIPIRTSSRRN